MSDLIPVEHQRQRILTTKQLAEVYQTSEGNISNNFNNNMTHFTEGKHYHLLEGEALREFKRNSYEIGIAPNVNKLYLWTARGANRHCKILDTDKAWEQFDNLEETYFNPKSLQPKLPTTYLEALEALVASEKEKQILLPKAQYFDALVERNLLTNFRDTAKELKIKEGLFIVWLLDEEYVYRDLSKKLKPFAQHVPKLFEIKEWSNDKKAGNQTLITPRGRETFRLLLSQLLSQANELVGVGTVYH